MSEQPDQGPERREAEPETVSIAASPEGIVAVLQHRYPEQFARCVAEAAAVEAIQENRRLRQELDAHRAQAAFIPGQEGHDG